LSFFSNDALSFGVSSSTIVPDPAPLDEHRSEDIYIVEGLFALMLYKGSL